VSFSIKLSLTFFILLFSGCGSYYLGNEGSAKLTKFNSLGSKSFSFVIDREFLNKYSNSKLSSSHPKMTKYCFNKDNRLHFEIDSKQEKVYDVTFLNLIEQSYNTKPISPVTYFGKCL
jgi:hypothetical protein